MKIPYQIFGRHQHSHRSRHHRRRQTETVDTIFVFQIDNRYRRNRLAYHFVRIFDEFHQIRIHVQIHFIEIDVERFIIRLKRLMKFL